MINRVINFIFPQFRPKHLCRS